MFGIEKPVLPAAGSLVQQSAIGGGRNADPVVMTPGVPENISKTFAGPESAVSITPPLNERKFSVSSGVPGNVGELVENSLSDTAANGMPLIGKPYAPSDGWVSKMMPSEFFRTMPSGLLKYRHRPADKPVETL